MNKKRILIGFTLLAAFLIFHFLRLHDYVTLASIKKNAHMLQHMVQQNYLFAVFVYLLLFIAATISVIPITAALTIAGGFLFGVWFGALYAITGATISAVLMFVTVRYVIGKIVQEKYGNNLATLYKEIKNHGTSYVLMVQLLPVTPTPLINLVAGLTPLSAWTFAWTTAVGILPGTLVYTWAGQQLYRVSTVGEVMTWRLFFVFVLLALMALMPMVYRRARQ